VVLSGAGSGVVDIEAIVAVSVGWGDGGIGVAAVFVVVTFAVIVEVVGCGDGGIGVSAAVAAVVPIGVVMFSKGLDCAYGSDLFFEA